MGGFRRLRSLHFRRAVGQLVRVEDGDLTAAVGEEHGVLPMSNDMSGLVGGEYGIGQSAARCVENLEAVAGRHQHVFGVSRRIHPQETVFRDVGLDLESFPPVDHQHTAVIRRDDRFADVDLCRCALTLGLVPTTAAAGHRHRQHR